MTTSCVNCASCGKCYQKEAVCLNCGSEINLLDNACVACGNPITEEMRESARQAYVQQKMDAHDVLFPGLKKNREKRQKWLQNHRS